jgi:hypothetical protein
VTPIRQLSCADLDAPTLVGASFILLARSNSWSARGGR